MSAFLGISLWVALATVVPGLVTIACLYGAIVIVSPSYIGQYLESVCQPNDWICAGIGISIMVLTQAIGIILEDLLVGKRWLGPEIRDIEIAEGIDPHKETHIQLKPYFEYEGLYILLAELREDEDTQGHLKRALAQFFLTNNTLVSFGTGITFAFVICALFPSWDSLIRAAVYAAVLSIFLILSYKVAAIRFEVMAKSLWATRRRRLTEMMPGATESGETESEH